MKVLFVVVLGAVLIVGGIVGIATVRFDPVATQGAIESGLEAATGRTWHVDAEPRFVPGLVPAVEVDTLTTPNTPWASEPAFVEIGSVRLESRWLSLVLGSPEITTARIADVTINLETDADGGNNWTRAGDPAPPGPAGGAFHLTQSFVVERVRIQFRSGWADAGTSYPIDTIRIENAGPNVPLAIALDARVKQQPLSIGGQLGSPATMFGGKPFNIALTGRYSGRESQADVVIDGHVARLAGLEALNAKFTLKADSLNEVGSISGFELPRDTPVTITATAVNRGAGPELTDYVLRIGQAIIRPQD